MVPSKKCLLMFTFVAICIGSSEAQLKVGFYNKTCPNAENITRQVVNRAFANNTGIAAGLIRLHFHDCFVRGCDGSVLIDSTANNTAEKDGLSNFPSLRGFEVVDAIKAALEAQCPRTVSCADILAFAARDSSVLTGNITYKVPAGRRDGRISLATEADNDLPPPFFNATELVNNFRAKNLTSEDMVVLSGAHSIGRSHCVAFANRLYNGTTPTVDPTLSQAYADLLRSRCPPVVPRNDSRTVLLDIITPEILDNKYYTGLPLNLGLFTSDHALITNSTLNALVNKFIRNENDWKKKFAKAMVKMGAIEVKTGTTGEIRTNCRVINPTSSNDLIIETLRGSTFRSLN